MCVCGAGVKAHADILRLVATLLVLQLLRVEKLEEGKLLHTLFSLDDPSQSRSEQNQKITCHLLIVTLPNAT